jgi:hypothetical protein
VEDHTTVVPRSKPKNTTGAAKRRTLEHRWLWPVCFILILAIFSLKIRIRSIQITKEMGEKEHSQVFQPKVGLLGEIKKSSDVNMPDPAPSKPY